MTKVIADVRLHMMQGYADQILRDTIQPNVLLTLFDEIFDYREHYKHWHGESSVEYRLANTLLTFSRIFKNTREPSDKKVSIWLKKQPIYIEWFERIKLIASEFSDAQQ